MSFFALSSPAYTTIPEIAQAWRDYQELNRTQWLSPAELEQLQLGRLRDLLKHCAAQIPYYRRVLSEANLDPQSLDSLADLRRLPLLTKELYKTQCADMQARSLPADMKAAGEGSTSGTSGVPIKVLKTNRTVAWWHAFCLRDLEWSGLDPRRRIAVIRRLAASPEDLPRALEGITLPYWNKLWDGLLQSNSSYLMDIRQDPRRQLEWLQSVRPDYLLSMPSNLEVLADLLADSGCRLPELRAIQAMGETLSEATRRRIETVFAVPVKNLYSSHEAGYIASPCPEGHGLHVHSENIVAEVVDADNRSCQPGETGRLVVTTLHNFRAPFIRYDIQDDVTLAAGPCRCGRGLPLWTHVEGRRLPFLYLPSGRRKSPVGISRGIRSVGGCIQYQVIQRAVDHVVIRIKPDQTWQDGHAARIRQMVQQEFEANIRVDVETKSSLQPTDGGKFRIVVVEL